jgi:hypothetical protein
VILECDHHVEERLGPITQKSATNDTRVRRPTADELLEVADLLNLSSEGSDKFVDSVNHLWAELDAALRQGINPLEARRRRLKALKETHAHLRRARAALMSEHEFLDMPLAVLMATDWGVLFSPEAVRQLSPASGYPRLSEIDVRNALKRERDPTRPLELLLQRSVVGLLCEAPTEAIIGLFSTFEASIAGVIAAEANYRGGRPKDATRVHALERLHQLHLALLGQPTATSGGSYMQLCEHVLESLGLPSGGLEASIKRHLRAHRRQV